MAVDLSAACSDPIPAVRKLLKGDQSGGISRSWRCKLPPKDYNTGIQKACRSLSRVVTGLIY